MNDPADRQRMPIDDQGGGMFADEFLPGLFENDDEMNFTVGPANHCIPMWKST